MISVEVLRAHLRRQCRLVLRDGLMITAEILDVLDDQDHDQVAYKLHSVLAPGQTPRLDLVAGRYYTTDLSEIVSIDA